MRKSAEATVSDMFTISGQFAEFDQFMEFSAAWDIDFRQIGPGALNAKLSQAVGESWSLARCRFDRAAFQQGAAIPGMRTFAILGPQAPEYEWCGRSFSPGMIAVFAKDCEYQSISPPGFDAFTLSFADEQLAAACERLSIPDATETFSSCAEILQVGSQQTFKLRQLVNSSLQALCETGLQDSGWTESDHIRDTVAEHLVMLLTDGSRLNRTPSQRTRSLAIYRALEAIEDGLDKSITVREVARISRVSRRTLEYSFRDRYGFSPKAFINSQRLVQVRRDLYSKPENVPIAEIANRWGFWHMGQFAQDYRIRFGELPSQTVAL